MQQDALIYVFCIDRMDDKSTEDATADLRDWTKGIITYMHNVKISRI